MLIFVSCHALIHTIEIKIEIIKICAFINNKTRKIKIIKVIKVKKVMKVVKVIVKQQNK